MNRIVTFIHILVDFLAALVQLVTVMSTLYGIFRKRNPYFTLILLIGIVLMILLIWLTDNTY